MKTLIALCLLLTGVAWLAACGDSPAAPRTGALAVQTNTTGQSLDLDGYTLLVEGDSAGRVGTNETRRLGRVSTGPLSVELVGVAPNCVVAGANPRQIDIEPDDTTLSVFAVVCHLIFGQLHLGLEISGEEPDPNGFYAVFDDTDTLWLASSRSLSLPEGMHSVDLLDVANNCQVDPAARQTFEMPRDGGVSVVFVIACPDLPGAIRIETATSGRDPDADGYEVRTGPGVTAALPTDGVTIVPNLPSDSTTIELLAVASNCGAVGAQTRPRIKVPAADTVSVRFDVVCGGGHALEFDGSQFAQLAGSALPDMDSTWTAELWFRPDGQAQSQLLVGQWGVFDVATWRDAQGRVGFSAGLFTAQGTQNAITGTIPDTNAQRWRHIAVTYDRGQITVYLDGEYWTGTTGFGRSTASNSQLPLVVGARIDDLGGSHDAAFSGRIDELRIWDTVRTAAEIRACRDIRLAAGTQGLIAYWALEDGTGSVAVDGGGGGRDLILGAAAGPDSADATWVLPGRP